MTNQQHFITPPPKLVLQWRVEATNRQYVSLEFDEYIAEEAAQWGANQELEACCEWLNREGWSGESRQLRAARRPKPPSLKEQALKVLEDANLDAAHHNLIRRALKQLDD